MTAFRIHIGRYPHIQHADTNRHQNQKFTHPTELSHGITNIWIVLYSYDMINEEVLRNIVNEVKISVRKNNKRPSDLGYDIEDALLQIIARHPDVTEDEREECVKKGVKMYFEETNDTQSKE